MTESAASLALVAPDESVRASLAERVVAGDGCDHCGGLHLRACPRVKRLAFHPDRSLAEVEFWPDGGWDTSQVVWPEEVV